MGFVLKNNQSGYGGPSSLTSIAANAFTSALTPGSIILVSVTIVETAGVISISDSAGNVYVDCGAGKVTFGTIPNTTFQTFYTINPQSTGSNVVTAHCTVAGTFFGVTAEEWRGNSASPIDVIAVSANNSFTSGTGANNVFTGSATPNYSNELIYCACATGSGTVTAGTGFTGDGLVNAVKTEHLLQAAPTSVAGTFTDSGSGVSFAAIMVAVIPAGEGPWALTNAQSVGGILGSGPISTPAFANALTNPSIIVLGILGGSLIGPTGIQSISDTAGNSYVDCGAGIVSCGVGSSTCALQVFYAENRSNIGSNKITVQYVTGNQVVNIQASEWTGGALTLPVDVFAGFEATTLVPGTDTFVMPSEITTNNGELVLATVVCQTTNAISPGTTPVAFKTAIASESTGEMFLEYFVQGDAGATAPTCGNQEPSGDQYGSVWFALRPAVVPPPIQLVDVDFYILQMQTPPKTIVSVW